jgi:hypothetical protein
VRADEVLGCLAHGIAENVRQIPFSEMIAHEKSENVRIKVDTVAFLWGNAWILKIFN